jgi:hypothetical protein
VEAVVDVAGCDVVVATGTVLAVVLAGVGVVVT